MMTEERDPNGLDAHVPGAKLDAGKIRAGLMLNGFPRAINEVAKVTTYGAQKYSPNGWAEVPDGVARYDDAKVRHMLAGAREFYDQESGLLHMAQECWNALAKLELWLRFEESRNQ